VAQQWGQMLQGKDLEEGASTHFIKTFKNEFFSRNLGQKMHIF